MNTKETSDYMNNTCITLFQGYSSVSFFKQLSWTLSNQLKISLHCSFTLSKIPAPDYGSFLTLRLFPLKNISQTILKNYPPATQVPLPLSPEKYLSLTVAQNLSFLATESSKAQKLSNGNLLSKALQKSPSSLSRYFLSPLKAAKPPKNSLLAASKKQILPKNTSLPLWSPSAFSKSPLKSTFLLQIRSSSNRKRHLSLLQLPTPLQRPADFLWNLIATCQPLVGPPNH